MQIANELTAMLVGVGAWPSIIEEAFPQHTPEVGHRPCEGQSPP